MIKITLENKLFFIGKAEEIIEAIDELIVKYGNNSTLKEIIDYSLKT